MKLFILRHGEAQPRAASDAERQLTDRGRAAVDAVTQRSLADLAAVEKIWVSPYVRARQTAEVVKTHLPDVPLETTSDLTPESSVAELLSRLEQQPEQCVLLVSHQPLVGELVNGLTGQPDGFYSMGTANLACLEVDPLALGCGKLRWLR